MGLEAPLWHDQRCWPDFAQAVIDDQPRSGMDA
jgi:hypothetical protein